MGRKVLNQRAWTTKVTFPCVARVGQQMDGSVYHVIFNGINGPKWIQWHHLDLGL